MLWQVNPHTHQLKLCDFGSAKVLVIFLIACKSPVITSQVWDLSSTFSFCFLSLQSLGTDVIIWLWLVWKIRTQIFFLFMFPCMWNTTSCHDITVSSWWRLSVVVVPAEEDFLKWVILDAKDSCVIFCKIIQELLVVMYYHKYVTFIIC